MCSDGTLDVPRESQKCSSVCGDTPLRTLDGIHVASAQFPAARVARPELRFVTGDKWQTEAVAAIGFAVKYIA